MISLGRTATILERLLRLCYYTAAQDQRATRDKDQEREDNEENKDEGEDSQHKSDKDEYEDKESKRETRRWCRCAQGILTIL